MQHNSSSVSAIEKIISILSYFTFGIAGMIWLLFAFAIKKNLRYFLMYNIAQSMVISILFAIINLIKFIIIKLLLLIPFISTFAIKLNLFFSTAMIKNSFIHLNILQILVTLLILYIIAGVIIGKIFYIPFLSNIMSKAMQQYKN